MLLSDKTFLQDYNPRLSRYRVTDPFQNTSSEGVSQLYLTGKGNRSYFDVRSIYYMGFSTADVQSQIPIIHPVIDYTYTFDHPVLGGELGYNINFTSLTRNQANFDAITQTALNNGTCAQTADPAIKNSANCLLRGIPGTYSRFSAETHWRRSFTDSFGQVFTPFVSLRADAGSMQINSDPGVSNFIDTGDSNLVRAMPTVGLEYRYPFISVQSWGTQTVEPIAQVIARPNETQIGKWPNEDAQSLIFDDSNLFRVDKFSGWDRVEGGGRANYGVQYTAQFNQGGFVNALFGQSYSLFGQNSFAVGGISQYRPRQRPRHHALRLRGARLLPAEQNLHVHLALPLRQRYLRRAADGARGHAPSSIAGIVSLLYGDYAAQPDLGFLDRRQGVLGYRIGQARRQLGAARRRPLRHRCRQFRPDPARRRLYRRLPHLGPELHY